MGEEIDFKCPICDSAEYDYKPYMPATLGGRTLVEYYTCKGCSVIFGDLKKFTSVKKNK